MKKTVLREYAKLIALKGVNIQKGQEVVIRAGLDQPEFVEMLVKECYKAGASDVTVEWGYQPLTALNIRYKKQKDLNKIKDWELERMKYRAETLPCTIFLTSEDPDGLKGVNQEKMMKARQAQYPVLRPIRRSMENKYQWCIAGVPGKAWAKKVFPGERTSVAIEKLWEAILHTSRAEVDPITAWNEHNADLKKRYDHLNSLGIKKLKYSASNGTDFTVGMIDDGIFTGGGETTLGGIFFNPNIPSEEIFTSPMKGEAEGIVYATKPLSYNGELIENFSVRFEKGKAVEVKAEKSQALLEKMISMDEGASYLGEVALVPWNSPINETGILFYNTLYDENACCHLALGQGFNECLKGFEELTPDECTARGINDSMIHVDFMIGSPDLVIDAYTKDGETVRLFDKGTWAF